MKKLFTLIIVASLALTIQAQNVTNKLGTSGNFYINDENDNEIIKVDAGGTFHFKNEVSGSSTQFDMYNAGHNLKINFYKAYGTPSNLTTVADGANLGLLFFHGYTGSGYYLGAAIEANVSGTVSGSTMPTGLEFYTRETTNLTNRMTIKPNGTVNIAKNLEVEGSMALALNSGTADYTLTASDFTYITNNSTANGADVTLPTAVGITGRVYIIKNTGSGDQKVLTTSSQTIDGVSDYGLTQWKFAKVQSDGSNWIVIGQSNY